MAASRAGIGEGFDRTTVRTLFSSGQDCLLCLERGAPGLLCESCEQTLPVIESPCPQCGVAAAGGGFCGECLANPPRFDAVFSAFAYGFPADKLVQRFKFSGDLALGAWLGDAMARSAATRTRPDLLIPAPLSVQRLRSRGFNQALVLARRVARRLRLPVDGDAIAKGRDTPPQAGLSRAARQGNLRGAFQCRRRLDGLQVALVDDVMTTGATADALAAALKASGAARVDIWVVARTPQPNVR